MEPARTPGSDAVLVVGVDPRRVPGPWDPEPVVRAIADAVARLRDEGFAPTTCLVGLDGSDDVVEVVTRALRLLDRTALSSEPRDAPGAP